MKYLKNQSEVPKYYLFQNKLLFRYNPQFFVTEIVKCKYLKYSTPLTNDVKQKYFDRFQSKKILSVTVNEALSDNNT